MTDRPVEYAKQVGKRLRERREKHGITQAYVAQALGVPRQAVSEIENGHRSIDANELFKLSKLFGIDPSDLFVVRDAPAASAPMWLRAESIDDECKTVLSRFEGACDQYAELESILGVARQPDLRALAGSVPRFETAQGLAREEQGRLGLGSAPAWTLLECLEERVGVKVLDAPAPPTLLGACLWNDGGPAILLNSRHGPTRNVFTLAHEYFHLIAPAASGNVGGDGRICGCVQGKKSREDQLADQFAAELLMPRDAICGRWDSNVSSGERSTGHLAVQLAIAFGVTVTAILFRLENLRLVTKAQREAAAPPNDARSAIENSSAARCAPPVEPRRRSRLAAIAYLRNELSRSRLAEIVDVGLNEVDAWLVPYREGQRLDEQLNDAD